MSRTLEAIASLFTGLGKLTREAQGIRKALEALVELRRVEVYGQLKAAPGGGLRSGYTAGADDEAGSVLRDDNDHYSLMAEIRERCHNEGLPAPELDEDLEALARHRGWLP